jgi:hypothetical protein
MASRHLWAGVALVLAAIAWAVALFIEPSPWDPAAASVIASGLMVMMAVAVVAIMIESSRFGYWLGVSGLGLMLVLAGLKGLDTMWVISIALTAVAGVLMADRRLGGWIRTEGPVAPVPSRATGLGLLLLLAPILTALFLVNESGSGAIVWLTLGSWGILVAFVRRLPGALAAVRLGAPLLIGGSAFLDLPGAATWGSLMVAASVLAWSRSTRLAIRPLIERGSRVSIPPELLSDDLRRAAGIDRDQG